MPSGFQVRGRIPAGALDPLAPGRATRARVLLALGEPDHAWDDDRYFLYRWTTVSGYWLWFVGAYYQGAGGLLAYGEREHDLLFEFDGSGLLRWRGDLRAWGDSDEAEADLEDRALPMVLSAGHLHASGTEPSWLTLDRSEISFRERRRSRHDIRFEPARIESVRLHHFAQLPRTVEEFGCELVFREGRHRKKLRFVLAPEETLVLVEFVRHASPAAKIEG